MPEGEYKPDVIEPKWRKKWIEEETYKYEKPGDSEEVFSIDTPPPTVSGNLHFGHTYGNTLADFKARFERMQGKSVYYPFGYDNNGIASERLTERELDIRHQDFTRREFQKKVRKVCEDYEEEFEDLMRDFGFSMDWNNTYKTIEPRVQKISQLSFLDLHEKDLQYREKAPAIWCPECETAISQVETEDLEKKAHFHDIEFDVVDGDSFTISTTRPELLPACVAVFVHPDDEENQHLVGEEAKVPLFYQKVPIIEDERVDMETGSGIVMCCTFGDQNDIEWYQAHGLDLRVAIDESGVMTEEANEYEGLTTEEARKEIVKDLDEEKFLLDKRKITHTVQAHERCDTPIEFLVKPQWYIKVLENKEKYLEAGEQMEWYPEKMFTRYKNWIEGLQWDWCISRQRDSGIPIPVWYHKETGEPVVAEKEQLPVDPLQDEPPVDNPEEYKPETDVLDTWATSSLTPLINAKWDGEELQRPELYQFDLRYQGHDIISFWLFHTVVKCIEHTGEVPFKQVMNHGHVLDENREKMSKSRGNVVLPQNVIEEYPVDAARYWSAGTQVGDDLAFKEKDLVSGEKVIRKLWNASKLVEMLVPESGEIDEEDLEELDRWMLAELDQLVEFTTEKMENYEFSKARDQIRHVFWNTFCDNYLEIAKQRMDEERDPSAEYTLSRCHETFLKLFAPFLSHVTEEIWNDMYSEKSIHNSKWPETLGLEADLQKGETAIEVISALRKYKSDNQMSPTAELEEVAVYGDIEGFEEAVKEVMHVQKLELDKENRPETENEIVEIKLDYSKAGPKYGDKVSEIEEALENNEWNLMDGRLRVADEQLKPEMFNVREERTFQGEGKMIETENITVVVK